jgi:oxygen-independent coproporphyrinogen-3 oxidase
MGYTTCAQSDVLAFGASSISELRNAYVQNVRDVPGYLEAMAVGGTPAVRGLRLTLDDKIRKEVMHQLFCRLGLSYDDIGAQFGIDAGEYFAAETAQLDSLARDGLVTRSANRLKVTERGQVLLRNVAAVFDSYLRPGGAPAVFSQAV